MINTTQIPTTNPQPNSRHTHLHLVDGLKEKPPSRSQFEARDVRSRPADKPFAKGGSSRGSFGQGEAQGGLLIDCDACAMQHTSACDDCVVSYLVGYEPEAPVLLNQKEFRAVELLCDVGLVPSNKFTARAEAMR